MWGSRKRLDDDVRRWRKEGWVTADGERQILDELAHGGRGLNLATALGILASVLLAFAVISFVAAHWNEIGRLPRLLLLFGLIASGYGAAGIFEARRQPMFADAAILFAVAMFGASIALISQMFHIDGHPPDGILLWLLGAVVAGVVLQSNPALAFSVVLLSIWSGMRSAEIGGVHWPFLIGWAVISAAFLWQRWKPGAHISGVALAGFVITLGYLLDHGREHSVVVAIGLLIIAAAVLVRQFHHELDAIATPALGYGIAVAFAGVFAMQFIDPITRSSLIFIAALTLAGLLGAIWYGLDADHRGALWLGYVGFSIEVLAFYWTTVGSLLDRSLFFLVAGLIVAGLAAMAWRLAARQGSGGVSA